jgi:hypothetical protein
VCIMYCAGHTPQTKAGGSGSQHERGLDGWADAEASKIGFRTYTFCAGYEEVWCAVVWAGVVVMVVVVAVGA